MRSFYQGKPSLRAADAVHHKPALLLKAAECSVGCSFKSMLLVINPIPDLSQSALKVEHFLASVSALKGYTHAAARSVKSLTAAVGR